MLGKEKRFFFLYIQGLLTIMTVAENIIFLILRHQVILSFHAKENLILPKKEGRAPFTRNWQDYPLFYPLA